MGRQYLLGKAMPKSNKLYRLTEIGVIVAMIFIAYLLFKPPRAYSNDKTLTRNRIAELHLLCDAYKEKYGQYPRQESWTNEIVCKLVIDNREVLDTDLLHVLNLLKDAWGSRIQYRRIDDQIHLYPFGPDRIDDSCSGDDIFLQE